MADPGEASGCVRTQAKAGVSCAAHAGASTSSQWLQDLYKVLENTPVFDTLQTPGLSRTASSPGGAKAQGLNHWKPALRSSAVITLPLRFNSAYALPTLGSESDETRRTNGEKEQAAEASTQNVPQVVMEEPAFTAYHGWQKGCIDYIFYHSKSLDVARIYQLPALANAKSYGCCPNKVSSIAHAEALCSPKHWFSLSADPRVRTAEVASHSQL
ncbi:endonuclease/exonuclease/phosphatase family protein [Toxoplasma gondii MAS]|nr:endonuclease/exonuclease/phosphatase family protein [Toxoplasma gondii MAS]